MTRRAGLLLATVLVAALPVLPAPTGAAAPAAAATLTLTTPPGPSELQVYSASFQAPSGWRQLMNTY